MRRGASVCPMKMFPAALNDSAGEVPIVIWRSQAIFLMTGWMNPKYQITYVKAEKYTIMGNTANANSVRPRNKKSDPAFEKPRKAATLSPIHLNKSYPT